MTKISRLEIWQAHEERFGKTQFNIVNIIATFLITSIIAVSGYMIPNKTSYNVVETKTLSSEVDRLSIKYKIASSTVYKIIKCESQMYGDAENENLDKNGEVWSTDHSWLQINDYFHADKMESLGLDIEDKWDALEYGFILMKKEGLKPWSASAKCWK